MANVIAVNTYQIAVPPFGSAGTQFNEENKLRNFTPGQIKSQENLSDAYRTSMGIPKVYGRITVDEEAGMPTEYLTSQTIAQIQTLANA